MTESTIERSKLSLCNDPLKFDVRFFFAILLTFECRVATTEMLRFLECSKFNKMATENRASSDRYKVGESLNPSWIQSLEKLFNVFT